MGNKNELLQKLDEKYVKFSKGQKKLADFIRNEYDKAAFMTAAKLGETNVPEYQDILVKVTKRALAELLGEKVEEEAEEVTQETTATPPEIEE